MIKFGYIPSKIEDTHYQFGASSLPKDILQSDGNWKPYLPSGESQAVNFETDGCVPFGTTNCLETLMKKIYGDDYNYSERFLYNLLRITPPIGSDPHSCAEYVRTNGAIPESSLPMTSTLDEYSKPRPVTPQYLTEGSKWLALHSFGHEWVFTNNPPKAQRLALIKEALQYSPLGLTVTAWYPLEDGMYPDNLQPNNHWVECYGMDGDSLLIFDSYSQDGLYFKKLHPDHHIEMCKRYYVGTPTPPIERTSLVNWFIQILKNLWTNPLTEQNKYDIINTELQLDKVLNTPVETNSQKLYNLSYSLIGQHLTLDDTVPKEYGCAQALSKVLSAYGLPIPPKGISSTQQMEIFLASNCKPVDIPQPGDIIISVSYTGVPGARGHTGIWGKESVMSNASDTGEWQPWWSNQAWLSYYQAQKKLRTRFFRV